MSSQEFCRNCGHRLNPSDRFCSNCGTQVQSGAAQRAQPDTTAVVCPLCGQRNTSTASFCESCGAALTPVRAENPIQPKRRDGRRPERSTILTFLQSWKLTVVLAFILIGVIVVLTLRRDTGRPDTASAPHTLQTQMAIQQIDSLQKVVDAHPDDAQTLLRFANLLQDVRVFPRAIEMYKRYLLLRPTDADARVDLGVSYFDLALMDSIHGRTFLDSADVIVRKALTYQPNHQLGHFNLGIINLHRGDIATSNGWFRMCIAIDSTTRVGQQAKEILTQHPVMQ